MSQCAATLRRRNGTLPSSSDTTETTETLQDWRSKSYQTRTVLAVLRGRVSPAGAATCDQYAGDYVCGSHRLTPTTGATSSVTGPVRPGATT
jgi:hypothetical protein